MKKRTALSVIAAALMAVIFICTGGASEAAAQNCCSYTVRISTTIPPSCLPLRVGTRWGAGVWHSTHTTAGVFTVTPVGAPFPVCPPNFLGNLVAATLNNFGNSVGPNACACIPSGTTPCKLYVCTYLDPAGCWVVDIRPCP